MAYDRVMSATLTIPADESLERALRERAEAQGKTIPEMAREILSQALLEPSVGRRTEHLKGRLELPSPRHDSWREELRGRNWPEMTFAKAINAQAMRGRDPWTTVGRSGPAPAPELGFHFLFAADRRQRLTGASRR